MTADQLELFRNAPAALWLLQRLRVRAGSSVAVALARASSSRSSPFTSHVPRLPKYLAPGERATLLILAADRKQSRVIFRYIAALLKQIPMLALLVENERAESFELTTRVTIEVGTCSYRTIRGYTFAAVLCDELAFWRSDDSAHPDDEIINAVRPGMATIPNAMLLCGSSPYARRGALYDTHQKHHGKDGPMLVWQAATRTMNPTVPQAFIDTEMEKDPASAAAEYMAEFRTDIEAFLTIEALRGCVDAGVLERPYDRQHAYFAFTDPSGGSSDSFILVIAHVEGGVVVIDCIRERHGTIFTRAGLLRARRYTEELPDLDCHWRQLWRCLAEGAVRQARHQIRFGGQAQVETVSRLLATGEFEAGHAARQRQDGSPVSRARAQDKLGRQGQHRPRPWRSRRHCQRCCGRLQPGEQIRRSVGSTG